MEIKSLIRSKLLQYLSDDISKDALYKWDLEILHKLLKGDILDKNYLEVWGIITGLADINDMDDLYCHDMVERFNRILVGVESASFAFAIQIPKKFVVNNLLHLKKTLQKYALEKQLSKGEILELGSITQKVDITPNSLNDILELQIIDLLKLGYDFCPDEGKPALI